MTREQRNTEHRINRMRRMLELFDRMERLDRWYVLTRIAQKDDPTTFDQVVGETRLTA